RSMLTVTATLASIAGGGTLSPSANTWTIVPGLTKTVTPIIAEVVDLNASVNVLPHGYNGYGYVALFVDGSLVVADQHVFTSNQAQSAHLEHALNLSAGSHSVEVRALFPSSGFSVDFDTTSGYSF